MLPKFFADDRNRLHGARIAGMIYVAGAIVSLSADYWSGDVQLPHWCPRLAFTGGWWLAFCSKRPPQSISELLLSSPRAIGVVLLLLGLMFSFYWPFPP